MLRLWNTLTREMDPLPRLSVLEDATRTGTKPKLTFYACGPTVYWYAHIGNLRTYVMEDVLRRTLEHEGVDVLHVMNITDVGHLTDDDVGVDKMEQAATKEKKTARELAKFYGDTFKNDLHALHVEPPLHWTHATAFIAQMIALIQRLETRGMTYQTSDGIYFDTAKFPTYRDLARLDLEGLTAGARVEFSHEKRNASDFALWKFSPEAATGQKRQMEWDSPWGIGFPGWHIECSAMAMTMLGETIDLHAGGIDHIPVHHTNEIAQSEAATGKPFVHHWFHVEFLNLSGEKMAKSSGDVLTLHAVIRRHYGPRVLRYFYLTSHYRSKQEFGWQLLDNARESLGRIDAFIERLRAVTREEPSHHTTRLGPMMDEFFSAMLDDLDTPLVLSRLFVFIRSINTIIDEEQLSREEAKGILERLADLDTMLGVIFWIQEKRELTPEMYALLELRNTARGAKDFETADRLRDRLLEIGVTIKDTPKGQAWSWSNDA